MKNAMIVDISCAEIRSMGVDPHNPKTGQYDPRWNNAIAPRVRIEVVIDTDAPVNYDDIHARITRAIS